jgi:hypothetical protein
LAQQCSLNITVLVVFCRAVIEDAAHKQLTAEQLVPGRTFYSRGFHIYDLYLLQEAQVVPHED